MKIYQPLVLAAALLSSCATMTESMQLGASMGGATGMTAAFAGRAGTGNPASFNDIAIGAAIGTGLGVLTSYLVHNSVEERRQTIGTEQTEMHFGDLPPSPFVLPRSNLNKKGAR